MVEARVMHSGGLVAPPVSCRVQVPCKVLGLGRAFPVRGLLHNHMEKKHGYHYPFDHRRCAAVARRRLVWPWALVLVSEEARSPRTFAQDSTAAPATIETVVPAGPLDFCTVASS
jgi:hypothetical protein